MPSTYNVMIMGASYGSLLATKLLFAGHKVKLVCLPAEAEVIGHDDPMPGGSQRADEVAVDESPGGVAVHEHDRAPVAWPFVDVVHPPVGRGEPAGPVRPRAAERLVRVSAHSASHW